MLNIGLFSNDSDFLDRLSQELYQELEAYSKETFRIQRVALLQTSLYSGDFTFDFSILDITENPASALALAASLSPKSEVMVVASGRDWAMDAYNADVVSYLTTPVDVSRMARLILRRLLRGIPQEQEPPFSFRTAAGTQLLPLRQISFVEYSDHRMRIHTDSGKEMLTTTMRASFSDAAAQLLNHRNFVRTHASFIVNILHVSQLGPSSLTLDTGTTVPISHGRHKAVKEKLQRFFQGEHNSDE